MLGIFPGWPVNAQPPVLPYAYRPLEPLFLSNKTTNYPKWQYAFHRVGAMQSQIFIYFVKVENGSGVMELELVKKLSTMLQGQLTAPLNTERAWIYFVYTPDVVAVELRKAVE